MADNRFSLRDIIATLAGRSKTSSTQAEDFIKAFIDTIMDGLRRDTIVRVKGLGTFKLIQVENRESINVNTGERFMIEGHTKVSFTPEAALRDHINKPFADFQTVVLNDEMVVPTTDIESTTTAPQDSEDADIEDEPIITDDNAVVDNEEVGPTEAEEEETEPAEEEAEPVLEAIIEDNPTTVDETPAAEPALQQPQQVAVPPVYYPAEHHRFSLCSHILAAICTLLLCFISYMAGYYRWFVLSETVTTPPPPAVIVEPEPEAEQADSTDTEEPDTSDMALYPQVPNAPYIITGVKGVHKLESGQSLRQVAIKYYGRKDFVPYIIVLNEIANPDVVPVGKELLLPELQLADE